MPWDIFVALHGMIIRLFDASLPLHLSALHLLLHLSSLLNSHHYSRELLFWWHHLPVFLWNPNDCNPIEWHFLTWLKVADMRFTAVSITGLQHHTREFPYITQGRI